MYLLPKTRSRLSAIAEGPTEGLSYALGQKNMWVSGPYLAFGRRNPDPKLFSWMMLVGVSTYKKTFVENGNLRQY